MLKWIGAFGPSIQEAVVHALLTTDGGLKQSRMATHALLMEITDASRPFKIASAKVVSMEYLEGFHPGVTSQAATYQTKKARQHVAEKVGEPVWGLMMSCLVCWMGEGPDGRERASHLGQYIVTTKLLDFAARTKFDPDWEKTLKDCTKYKWFVTSTGNTLSVPLEMLPISQKEIENLALSLADSLP